MTLICGSINLLARQTYMTVMMNIKRISTNPKKIPKEILVSNIKGLNISGLNAMTPIKQK